MSKSKLGAFCVLALLCAAGFAVRHTSATKDVSAALSSDISEPEGTLTIQTQPVLTGLSSPVFVTNARDGSNRLFIIQQGGIIKILQPGATTTTDFINITSRVISGGERGLLGLAFHPQYTSNRRFFVYYTRTGDAAIQIAEYKVSAADPNVADTTELPIISVAHPTNANHNGGTVVFGPDGYLYFGTGDGGSANDPPNNAQNINQLLGKINRIDINVSPGGTTNYTIPPTNPFAGATPGADEIYMVGMRNPYRFSFDRQTGELWIGDVGQGAREEIDIGQLGGNFGWRTYEGTACTNLNAGQCVPANFIFPVAEYTHTGGRCSLTGGYRYRGRRGTFPQGAYIYGDYCTGEIFMLQGTTQTLLLDTSLAISSFGEDEAGEIYVVDLNGGLYKLVNPNAPIPRNVVDDFDGDLKSDLSVFRPSTGVWYIRNSFTNSLRAFQFGQNGDTITPGDYDGDGKTDAGVWRNGVFYVLRSSDNTVLTQAWGQAGDDPRVIADYDGDKKTDFAVLRRTTTVGDPAVWYIRLSTTGGMRAVQWGITGDAGVTGDYDGDGLSDVTVYRPSTNSYYVQRSRDGALISQQWGISSSDKIVPGDYDGDGQTDFAVFRTTNGVWYVLQSSNGQLRAQLFGVTGDEPVPGDYDADGKTDFAVVRNSSGNLTWYLSQSATNNVLSQQWGTSSDVIVPTFQTR